MKPKTEAKHTPGPWEIRGGLDSMEVVKWTGDRSYRFIALTDSTYDRGRIGGRNTAEDEANANLIAAAPELLEAAKHTCDYLDSLIQRTRTPEVELILRKLRGELEDAIAKAEGRLP